MYISILLGHFVKNTDIFYNFYPISDFPWGIRYHIQDGKFLVKQFIFHAQNEGFEKKIHTYVKIHIF